VQRVLGDNSVGLPYWDWAADGDVSAAQQLGAPLWQPDGIGGGGEPVADGPFRPSKFRVKIESGPTGRLRTTDRGLARRLGSDAATLPTTAQVRQVLNQSTYDVSPWDPSTTRFRNRLEGWHPPGPPAQPGARLGRWGHGTSHLAERPVFYLNHCNVDRIWESWMTRRGRTYVPRSRLPPGERPRIDDPMYNILTTQKVTPADVLDISTFYAYDQLP
jgi:tyrosinase